MCGVLSMREEALHGMLLDMTLQRCSSVRELWSKIGYLGLPHRAGTPRGRICAVTCSS